MKLNKLKKLIDKVYFANDQQLYVSTCEVMNGEDHDLDVVLCDKDGKEIEYLFEITNYNIFYEYEIKKFYFKDTYFSKGYWDGCRASYMPLYLDRQFYLKKFETITPEDIKNATDYFIHEILDLWMIFNIKVKDTYEKLPSYIKDGNCMNGTTRFQEICNLGYACDACPYNHNKVDLKSLPEVTKEGE